MVATRTKAVVVIDLLIRMVVLLLLVRGGHWGASQQQKTQTQKKQRGSVTLGRAFWKCGRQNMFCLAWLCGPVFRGV